MFALGNIWIGDYKVWITTPIFSVSPLSTEAENLPYYEVMVFKKIPNMPAGYYFYVNPMKDLFRWEMTDRNPLAKPKDKEKLTPEEVEFRVEANSYSDRKEMVMPLVKLSRRHVEQLLQLLCQ
jgi:hypothetical protein